MAVVSIASVGTSPGITTTAVALALEWPRPVVLVEADISKPSSVIAGFMQCQISGVRGLSTLSQIATIGHLDRESLLGSCVPLTSTGEEQGTEKLLLPAVANPEAAGGITTLWGELAELLCSLDSSGVDVIVDLGRWTGNRDRRVALAERADVFLYGLQPTFPALAAIEYGRKSIDPIRDAVGRGDSSSLVLFEAPAGGSTSSEVRKFLNMPVAGEIPFSPKRAAVFSQGNPATKKALRDGYLASIRSLRAKITKDLSTIRATMEEEIDA